MQRRAAAHAAKTAEILELPSSTIWPAGGKSALETRIRAAQEKVAEETAAPLAHGRCCAFGLSALLLVRWVAWSRGNVPSAQAYNLQILSASCDLISASFTLLLVWSGLQGHCVEQALLGPLVTATVAMLVIDTGALVGCFVVAAPRPTHQAPSYLADVRARLDLWLCLLCASAALQLAACVTAWRVYREMRQSGLYPPGVDTLAKSHMVMQQVSLMEAVCEAEDVELLTDIEARFEEGLQESCQPVRCQPLCLPTSSAPSRRRFPREEGYVQEEEDECDEELSADQANASKLESYAQRQRQGLECHAEAESERTFPGAGVVDCRPTSGDGNSGDLVLEAKPAVMAQSA